MKRYWSNVSVGSVSLLVVAMAFVSGAARAEKGEDVAAWENFIRYYPNDARAEQTFRAVVRAASAPEDYDRNLEYADLVDIEGAQYDDQTGELILIGPRIKDREQGHLPPLLVVDDFAMALRVLDVIGERALGVSIGTYNRGARPGEPERDAHLDRQPVEYIPELTAGTHMGFVFFEVDRWLKNVSKGVDNQTLRPISVRVAGYRTQQQRARPYFEQQAASLAKTLQGGPTTRPYGLNWFLPERPEVVVSGYSMKFVRYQMTVQYKAEEPDPAIAAFAEHMTDHFQAYCDQFPAFQELVRLHKLVQVAKWYRSCGFPDDAIVDYTPLHMPTPEYTRSVTSKIGRFNIPGGYYEASLVGGIDLTPSNVYYLPDAVQATRATVLVPGAPAGVRPIDAPAVYAPPHYGSYSGPAPVPAFVAPIVQARPTPTTCSWSVRIGGRILKAVAIPVTHRTDSVGTVQPEFTSPEAPAPPAPWLDSASGGLPSDSEVVPAGDAAPFFP